MEPAYVDNAWFMGGEAQMPQMPELRRARTEPWAAKLGFDNFDSAETWCQDPVADSVFPHRMHDYYGASGGYGGNDWWWQHEASKHAMGAVPGDIPSADAWSGMGWHSSPHPEVDAFGNSCLIAGPPPGLTQTPADDDFDLDLEDDCECAAVSVALAGLPSSGEPVERFRSCDSATTACTVSSSPEDLVPRAEGREPPPQSQALVKVYSPVTGVTTVIWTVDAKKLRGSDKVAVSSPFEMDLASGTFKIMLCPKAVSDRKGGASFKKAKGKGFVQLKFDGESVVPVSLNVSVGTGRPDVVWQNPMKDPVIHDFNDCGVCSLQPKNEDDWNFMRAVDEPSQTFAVRLEMQPIGVSK